MCIITYIYIIIMCMKFNNKVSLHLKISAIKYHQRSFTFTLTSKNS